MLNILYVFGAWLVRAVVIKAAVLAGVLGLLAVVVPYAISVLAPYISTAGLDNAFAGIGPGIWWGLDFLRLDYGLPLVLSASVAGFLIRRIPGIG